MPQPLGWATRPQSVHMINAGFITPVGADVPFWGQLVFELGVGPEPIPRVRLTASGLAAAIRLAVTDQEMQARAAALGDQIVAEDSVAAALRTIREFLA